MEWIAVDKELPKGTGEIYKVRLTNGDEVQAYYFQDKCNLLKFYNPTLKLSYWWDYKTKEAMHNVTHWRKPKSYSENLL